MIPRTFAELTATQFADWISQRSLAVCEKVRAGQLGDAVGMLKASAGEEIALAVTLRAMAHLEPEQREQLRHAADRSTERSHVLERGRLLRDRKANPVKWEPIRERFLYGYRATLRNRGAEVVRTESGRWSVFCKRDGRQIHCGAAPDYQRERYEFRTMLGARRHAAEYVRSGFFLGSNLDTLPLAKDS